MPKDKHPPAFRFYVDDFISDSAVDAMTNEELGMYVRLLCKAWKEQPVGTIPDDDRVLASWCKSTPRAWAKCKAGVLRAFVPGGDGRYHQKRMKREWEKTLDYHRAKSEAGSNGAKNRWHSHSFANGKAIAGSMANDGISYSDSCSVSDSGDGDVDGAKCFDLRDLSEIRAKMGRFRELVDFRRPDDLDLAAKIAVLWHGQAFSDDDVEQVIESFVRKKEPIHSRGAWLHTCFENRCRKFGGNFNAMLAATTVPDSLDFQGE